MQSSERSVKHLAAIRAGFASQSRGRPTLRGSSRSLDSPAPLCYTTPARGFARDHGYGRIAQLVEQLTLNQRVQGSSPCAPTNQNKYSTPALQSAAWLRLARNGEFTKKLEAMLGEQGD